MKKAQRRFDDAESRSAVALTVVWMLTCMSTAVGCLVVLALRLLMLAFPTAASRVHPLGQAAGVLLFVSITTGVLCLALTPLVYRVRTAPPPRPVTIAAIAIGLAPILLAILVSLLQ
ncbi:MAG TPA: hypothetical protein VGI40_21645 [Pirellulaceae bacterium]|jgi:hypothetical protein